MALINCSQCGKEISDMATDCIHCGCVIEKVEKKIVCSECGSQVYSKSNVCNYCGCPVSEMNKNIDTKAPVKEIVNTKDVQTSIKKNKKEERNVYKLLSICFLIFVVIVIVIIILNVGNNKTNNNYDDSIIDDNKSETNLTENTFLMTCIQANVLNKEWIVENDLTLILPKNYPNDENLHKEIKGIYNCYDHDTSQIITDENTIVDMSQVDLEKVGDYTLNLVGKYENKIGNMEIKVKVVDSCSGNCIIKTTNWTFEIVDNIKYISLSDDGNYGTLKLQTKIIPTENAFKSSVSGNYARYSNTFDGYIYLRTVSLSSYNAKETVSYTVASTETLNYALGFTSEIHKTNALIKDHAKGSKYYDTTYLFFHTVRTELVRAYIDFYDKHEDKHHIYYLNV